MIWMSNTSGLWGLWLECVLHWDRNCFYRFIEIQFLDSTMCPFFKVSNLGIGVVTGLCDHHHVSLSEHFCHPKKRHCKEDKIIIIIKIKMERKYQKETLCSP